MVFDAVFSNSQPTDPALAVGPNHVMVVFNTCFAIYDKVEENYFMNASSEFSVAMDLSKKPFETP